MASRDKITAKCSRCGRRMTRMPGGHGLLHFEEGRQRVHIGLSDKPIASASEHARLMRQQGVVECNGQVPQSILKAGAKSAKMKEYLSKDRKGRWV